MRERAQKGFVALSEAPARQRSWVLGEEYDTNAADPNRVAFDHHGFLVVKGFANVAECDKMRGAMADFIEDWVPGQEVTVFRTDQDQLKAQSASDYFFGSSDRVHFFTEPGATEEDGSLKEGIPKERGLNKVGHGLHKDQGVFEAYSTSERLCSLVRSLGWVDPVLPQSMYIFKQPMIGGEVTAHQDSTFLYTTPRQTCLGLWLALHPATLENGCLWVRPGSHREGVRRVFARKERFLGKGSLNG